MNNERFILTLYNKNIFKEIDVTEERPCIKIGNLQDCDIRIKRNLYDLPICVVLRFDGNDWRMTCNNTLYMNTKTANECTQAVLHHGDILSINKVSTKTELFSLSFSYDFTVGAVNFDTVIDVRSSETIVIGNSPNAHIKLNSKYVGNEFVILTRDRRSGNFILDPTNAANSATLNGIRVFEKTAVREMDFIGVADYSFYYKNQVLYTASRRDMSINNIPGKPLRNETPAFEYPKLNRSPRMKYALDLEPIDILDPAKKPDKPRENLIMQLSPALAMLAVTIITRSGLISGLNTGNPAFLIFSVSSMGIGILTTVSSFIYNRRRYKKDLEQWKNDYMAYIANKRAEIEAERKIEHDALVDMYPSADSVRELVKTFSGRLFERSPIDDDFLNIRIGQGSVPAMKLITYRSEEHVKTENELMAIPQQLCSEYEMINDAPVMIHLREAGAVGVIGSADEQYEFFKSALLDLSVSHSYEEVQIVVLIPHGEQKKYEWIKWLPHIRNSGGEYRGIVCDEESRDNVFEYLYSLLTERSTAASDGKQYVPDTYYVVFVLDEYGIKSHPLSKYAASSSKLGFSFVHFRKYKENLPQECTEIVELNQDGGVLKISSDKQFSCKFTREYIKDESMIFIAERLAPVYCEKIALSSRLTTNISLFELLNIISPDDLDLAQRWKKSNVQNSLAAPLGVDVKGQQIVLDLHEKAHGPHGLVAGTTGSGKSEIMQSYILSAAVNFHPYEVAFVIIDFKGGGMANQFENLPHLVGKITDIDSHEINRSLLSIRAELEKRKRLFAQNEVNHIDQYIGKFRSGLVEVPLPHLILIVDEFAELKAEQPDFMRELISTARVGRSLGIHLILATQKPAGQVDEQIWSNSRFKLCLKVATKSDSNEVLKSPLAAEIREPGRAYLQVGNNEIFTLFQSAYSGASATSDKNGNMREFSISRVLFTGKRQLVFSRKVKKTSDGTKLTQLKAMVDYINASCEEAHIKRLPSICLPPLPEIADRPSCAVAPSRSAVVIGVYDDPCNQVQPDVCLDMAEGNVMIIGAAQTGKTTLLQTMIRCAAEKYSPSDVAVYILDFASKVLKMYSGLNHVGEVITDTDDEKLKNFFKMITEEIVVRKERFSQAGIGSYDAYTAAEASPAFPRIIIMIDNLSAFKDIFSEYEDVMLNICREGFAVGITVIATAKQTSGLSYKFLSNFAVRFAFTCTDKSEYSTLFDRCSMKPKDIPGRGLVSINKVVYEFQAFLPFDGIVEQTESETIRSESRRIEQTKAFVAKMSAKYGNKRARAVPSIPSVLTEDYWRANQMSFRDLSVPVALTYSEIKPVTIDLAKIGSVGIYGREGFGKSNLVRNIMEYLKKHIFDFDCKAYLLDDYERQLREFESYGFVEKYTIDAAEFEEIVDEFAEAAEERMDMLRMGEKFTDVPLMVCIIQSSQVYAANTVPKAVTDKFKRLLADAKQLKMCFIFSNIENNPEYSPPEMMRLARDLGQYFLLDDIADVKLFGANKFTNNDLKQFKKPLTLGEGYCYDFRNGLEKIKLMKNERS